MQMREFLRETAQFSQEFADSLGKFDDVESTARSVQDYASRMAGLVERVEKSGATKGDAGYESALQEIKAGIQGAPKISLPVAAFQGPSRVNRSLGGPPGFWEKIIDRIGRFVKDVFRDVGAAVDRVRERVIEAGRIVRDIVVETSRRAVEAVERVYRGRGDA